MLKKEEERELALGKIYRYSRAATRAYYYLTLSIDSVLITVLRLDTGEIGPLARTFFQSRLVLQCAPRNSKCCIDTQECS